MSKKHGKMEYVDGTPRGSAGRSKMHLNLHSVVDTKHKENVVRRLAELFQESFDLDLIQSVAQTCQWDFGKSTEALIVLGGSTQPKSRRSRRVNSLVESSSRHKTKSLPSTLKGHKSQSGRLSDSSTQSMPNGLRAHPAYFSNDSLAGSGQVWQRHYKSKPQSPGLLTMIPPSGKELPKLQKPASSRSSSQASLIKESPDVKHTSAVILRIEKLIQSNVKVMVLMRGVPGSGKTHLAQVVVKMVAANDRGQHIFSTDDYFVMLGRGVYNYDPSQLAQAHNWNQKRVSEALRRATNPVVVDNTHTQAWEMQSYVTMGVQHGYLIEVLEPVTPWKSREAELARRNVHNVPREKIRQMLDRYEPGWTGEKLLNLFQLKYKDCGAAHVSPELTGFSNSPLAQHRQHGALDQPEKPKRKKVNGSKKDRRQVPGVEINKSQEQQLEELNKLFAEYGKTIDPESRQKVIDAGVPIFEVVSRIRKLQGTLLPLPGIPPVISEEGPQSTEDSPLEITPAPITANTSAPDYLSIHHQRRSPTDSIEPDTMSSSNASETSDCDSDSDPEPLRRYLDDCGGNFVDGEDQWEDEEEAKSEGAVSSRPSAKCSGLVTSSQEELSIIDYQLSTPAGSSQDELSLLEFERGSTPNGSTSSSEEPKTELSTLQDSLRDVLLRSAAAQLHAAAVEQPDPRDQLMRDIASQTGSLANLAFDDEPNLVRVIPTESEGEKEQPTEQETQLASIEVNDSLLDILKRRFLAENPEPVAPTVDVENNVVDFTKTAKSPDLEEIPLPRIPEAEEVVEKSSGSRRRDGPKLETIVESALSPPDTDLGQEQRPICPTKKGGFLQNIGLNWSSLPIPGTYEVVTAEQLPAIERSATSEASTLTEPADFELWRSDCASSTIEFLSAHSRSINDPNTPLPVRSKAAVAMFDKGTMISEEDALEMLGQQDSLEALTVMFPDVPPANLADLLEKCKGDAQWVAELITDPSSTFQPVEEVVPFEEPVNPKIESIITDGKKTIKRRKDRKGPSSEYSQILKKEIESSFQIGEEHYSDQVLFVKKIREGEFSLDTVVPVMDEPTPFDVSLAEDEVAAGCDPTSTEKEAEVEQTIPMKVDPAFFRQLITRFAGPDALPSLSLKGYKPVINVPESIARNLYWLWVETLNEEVAQSQEDDEDTVNADAELAAALQEQELQERQPTMQELVDMALAEKLMLKDQELMDQKRGETAAAVLSRNILFDKYPNVDKRALLEVFNSEGCSLRRTCDTLQLLHGPPRPAKPPKPSHLTQQDRFKDDSAKKTRPMIIVTERAPKTSRQEQNVLVVDPSNFRVEIQLLQQRRSELLHLGQAEMSRKNFAVASHFFQEAGRLKERILETQATSISQHPFSVGGERLPTTLDLHFLFKEEAVQYVDHFLDHHITRLPSGRIDLFLITGQGKRSPSGLSRIKPVVEKRLHERQLNFTDDNPGMIRVTVHPNDLLSTAL